MVRLCLTLIAALITGCAAPRPVDSTAPGAPPGPTLPTPWIAPLLQDHPLVGRIWSREVGGTVAPAELGRALDAAALVAVGEIHPNPDHHRIQAELVRWVSRGGEAPVVGFEMLVQQQAAALDRLQGEAGVLADGAAVGEAVGWDASGWPPFSIYQPIFEAIAGAHGRVVAVHPDRPDIMAVARGGLAALDAAERSDLGLDADLPAALRESLDAEIVDSHCGYLPEAMVDPMAAAQRYKDAYMARALRDAPGRGPWVLVAGAGHTRRDRGVPYYSPGMLSIGLVEVSAEGLVASDYEVEAWDFVIFTPSRQDRDPCEEYKESLERMKAGPG